MHLGLVCAVVCADLPKCIFSTNKDSLSSLSYDLFIIKKKLGSILKLLKSIKTMYKLLQQCSKKIEN